MLSLTFFYIKNMISLLNSPIEKVYFENFEFFIKRDDLLDKDFSGNKARKFYYFLESKLENIDKIVSFGSNQSNAMYSLSVLAKIKNIDFIYYTNHLPDYLKENPSGNYKHALENKMNIIVGEYNWDEVKKHYKNALYIQEGGAIEEASFGIEKLALEINKFIDENNLINNVKVFLPSGTGTTALFLQKYIEVDVLTVPCVGDSLYLKKQFSELEENKSFYPTILKPKKKFHFGKLYKENYILWKRLYEETKIEFDLLYDPIGWSTILEYKKQNKDTTIIYVHQGGIKGNETMIERYKRKFDTN